MNMKNFLKRFVAAFGDAASRELRKNTAPPNPCNLNEAHPDRLNSAEISPATHDYSTLPPGYDPDQI